ncbi:pimeloyl-ACP methyl ester carboxylesterase [Planotetraspora sp. GP83]
MSTGMLGSIATRWKRLVLIAAAAMLAFAMAGAASTANAATVKTKARTAKPTIVFVHGAFADSSGWNAEIAKLRSLGYPVIAAPNPLRGLTGDADYVRSILQTLSGPIVLVGHSYGGAVITNAARGVANVKALVYVGAFVPDKDETVGNVLDPQKYPGSLIGPDTTIGRPFPNPAAPNGVNVDVYIKPESFRSVFAGDVAAGTAALMAATQRPLAFSANNDPSGEPAWKTLPSWDLITLADHAIPPAGQRFMAERAHAHIRTVDSSHAVMVSHPGAVVGIVLDAVSHVS